MDLALIKLPSTAPLVFFSFFAQQIFELLKFVNLSPLHGVLDPPRAMCLLFVAPHIQVSHLAYLENSFLLCLYNQLATFLGLLKLLQPV